MDDGQSPFALKALKSMGAWPCLKSAESSQAAISDKGSIWVLLQKKRWSLEREEHSREVPTARGHRLRIRKRQEQMFIPKWGAGIMSIMPLVVHLSFWPACLPHSHPWWKGLQPLWHVPITHKIMTCPIWREHIPHLPFPLICASSLRQFLSILPTLSGCGPATGNTGQTCSRPTQNAAVRQFK